MPLYHLDLNECGDRSVDLEGVECADDLAAHDYAIGAARSIMAEEVLSGRMCLSCSIEIRNELGGIVAIVPFRAALVLSGV